jgi:hypothetical protein
VQFTGNPENVNIILFFCRPAIDILKNRYSIATGDGSLPLSTEQIANPKDGAMRNTLAGVCCATLLMFAFAACGGGDEGSSSSTRSIFISEYIEGSGNNKALELYNPNFTAFDTTGWSLKQYRNNATTPETGSQYIYPLTVVIPASSTYILVNNSAGNALKEKVTSPTVGVIFPAYNTEIPGINVLSFTGDDAIGLFRGDTLVDIFGTPGQMVTSGAPNFADDTWVRKPGFGPSTTYLYSDWNKANAVDDFSNLGQHTYTSP